MTTRRAPLIAAIVGVVLVALVVLFVVSGSESDPLAVDTNQLVGKPAPAITATDTEGREFRTRDYLGQWLVVNFFATWCPPCVVEHPELVAFSEAHAASGDASVVSVAYEDTPSKVREFFDTHGGDWAVIADADSDFSIEFAVVGLPESYLIDPDGVVVHKFVGGVTKAEIEAEIATRS